MVSLAAGPHAARLPNLRVFGLTVQFTLLATDQFVGATDWRLAWLRRAGAAFTFIFGIFVVELATTVFQHWCCYPTGLTDLGALTRGLCTDAKAPVQRWSQRVDHCTFSHMPASLHALLAFWAVVAVLTWVGPTLYSWWHQDVQLKRAILTDSADILSLVEVHFDAPARAARRGRRAPPGRSRSFKDRLRLAVRVFETLEHKDLHAVAAPLLLYRSRLYCADPVSFLFNLPAAALDMPAWRMLVQLACSVVMGGCAALFFLVSLPAWNDTCCVHVSFAHWPDLGSCRDGDSLARQADRTRACDFTTATWDMYLELALIGVAFLVAAVNYLQTCLVYWHHSEAMCKKYLEGLFEIGIGTKDERPNAKTEAQERKELHEFIRTHQSHAAVAAARSMRVAAQRKAL